MPWVLVILALVGIEAFTVECPAGLEHNRLTYPSSHLVVTVFVTIVRLGRWFVVLVLVLARNPKQVGFKDSNSLDVQAIFPNGIKNFY
jgi:hypothetical protein